jgi:hypothetical protein
MLKRLNKDKNSGMPPRKGKAFMPETYPIYSCLDNNGSEPNYSQCQTQTFQRKEEIEFQRV